MLRVPFLRWAIVAGLVLAWASPASAQCPVGTRITIDFDVPGSGYSETSNNWATWNTAPCNGAGYRYLSHTVGDGSRMGKAVWKPAIARAGHYLVTTGYRATTNRTTDADFFAYDDLGAVVHKVVDQSTGTDCEWLDMGTFYCEPGGNCRVELDGTDDAQSDCADVTVYELVDCDGGTGGAGGTGGGSAGRCDGIRANPAWEVCEETDTTCGGVFTDGAGCVAYCAAAGMTCTARYGGEPGCLKEAQSELDCSANNGHASDWCECAGPATEADAGSGGSAAQGGAGGDAGQGASAGAAGAWVDLDAGGAGGTAGTGGASGGSGGSAGTVAAGGKPPDGTASGDDAGCGCRTKGAGAPLGTAGSCLALALLLTRRRRR